MKRLAPLVPLLALVAGCVSARRDAAEPALSVRLVRFSAWAADGAARDGAGSLSAAAIDLAGFAPTNACEATFAVAAADEMTVVFVHPADPARVPAEF